MEKIREKFSSKLITYLEKFAPKENKPKIELLKNFKKDKIVSNFLNPSYNFCPATNNYNYVISSDGKIRTCWDTVGKQNEVVFDLGNDVLDDSLEFSKFRWLNYQPDEQCLQCKLLPLCTGGCPYKVLLGKHECSQEKEYENFTIRLKKYVLNYGKQEERVLQ